MYTSLIIFNVVLKNLLIFPIEEVAGFEMDRLRKGGLVLAPFLHQTSID